MTFKIKEVIFVDEFRLDNYVSQFVSPKVKDVSFLKKMKLSLTNVGVELNESNHARDRTIFEKIEVFEKKLKIDIGILSQRPDNNSRWRNSDSFVKEETKVQRLIIPFLNDGSNIKGLNIWVSQVISETENSPGKNGNLILLEDFDRSISKPRIISGHSTMQLFFEECRRELSHTIIGAKHKTSIGKITNPINELIRLGAILLDERNVTTLYRIRASCNDMDNASTITTIGYPIYIMSN